MCWYRPIASVLLHCGSLNEIVAGEVASRLCSQIFASPACSMKATLSGVNAGSYWAAAGISRSCTRSMTVDR
jgi:hypothetical protein